MFTHPRTDAPTEPVVATPGAGRLDGRFGILGRTTAEYPHFGGRASESIAYASAVDARGRLLIAGHSFDSRGTLVASIARFCDNGILDTAFGIRGFVTLPTTFGDSAGWLRHIAIAPDGRIVVAFDLKNDTRRRVLLCRLLPNGAADTSFLEQGAGTLAFIPDALMETVRGLAILPDGRILLLASVYLDGAAASLLKLMRLLPDATPDTGFGIDPSAPGGCGITCPPGMARRRAWTFAVAPDGAAIVGGDLATLADDLPAGIGLVRVDRNGCVDRSFGKFGVVMPERTAGDALRQLLVRSDGRLLIVSQTGDDDAASITRCTQRLPDGEPDRHFGKAGEAFAAFGIAANHQRPQAACLQQDGSLLLAGTPWGERTGQRAVLTRLLSDGRRDADFGESGHVQCGFGAEFDGGDDIQVDSVVGVHALDGTAIVAGHLLEREVRYRFCAVGVRI